MPNNQRRRELDSRAGRFESEYRVSDMQSADYAAKRKFMCEHCHRTFEERSKVCPRCDKPGMGELRPIPSQNVEEARRRAIYRAQHGITRQGLE